MKRTVVCLLAWAFMAFGLSTGSWAQSPAGQPRSTIINEDGTVTFRYWNDNAKDVQVDVQFAGRQQMTRDNDEFLMSMNS